MTKLAETYINMQVWIPDRFRSSFFSEIEDIARNSSRTAFSQDIEVEILYRDGSLKIWVLYAGIIVSAIAQYGSFKNGIDQIIKDARWVSEQVFDNLNKQGLQNEYIIRKERRLGVSGRVRRALTEIEDFGSELRKEELSLIIKYACRDAHEMDRIYISGEIRRHWNRHKNDPPKLERRFLAHRIEDYSNEHFDFPALIDDRNVDSENRKRFDPDSYVSPSARLRSIIPFQYKNHE
ncbi:MAG: hypothetical protein ACU0B1_10415 [Thermohalobaculum sp.]